MKTTINGKEINTMLEYEFDHPSGKFTGWIRAIDRNLIRVLITSTKQKKRLPHYKQGEVRYVNINTPIRPTGRNPYRKPTITEE